ncbi:uncharacterized protein EI90DRAFT_3028766 [Cantharellus anzutake]|uniref:uncharacterized protein n=1 Tax=Cantharellus anzutake TaxID=1750568 RepID=UPI001908D35C|nr:uncharacterized protein EI90DRAFT_3028766 [Cantharellus anzutake]KAF8344216.1 hypothetical protein EI90DRAFT_3028766 [Cantharellus anzutake]
MISSLPLIVSSNEVTSSSSSVWPFHTSSNDLAYSTPLSQSSSAYMDPIQFAFQSAPMPDNSIPDTRLPSSAFRPPSPPNSNGTKGPGSWVFDTVPSDVDPTPKNEDSVITWYSFPPTSTELPSSLGTLPNAGKITDRERVRALRPFIAANDGTVDFRDLIEPALRREITMIDSEAVVRDHRSGEYTYTQPFDPANRFSISPRIIQACYTVPHWLLPPLPRLSEFARGTFHNILNHLDIIHEPTFQLFKLHGWLAYAICTAAGHRKYYIGSTQLDTAEPWDAVQPIVRKEKVLRALSRDRAKLEQADCMAAIQALLIYDAHSFLSENFLDRLISEHFLDTILKVRRLLHFLQGLERWIRYEEYRRTAWLVYLLDFMASLEVAAAPLVSPRDVEHLPVPAPQSAWGARSAQDWLRFQYRSEGVPFPLDFIMGKLFDFETEEVDAKSVPLSLLDVVDLGPFARLIALITVARGLIEYGEGKSRGGYVIQRWVVQGGDAWWSANVFNPDTEETHGRILTIFALALERWKIGWDRDSLCNQANWGPDIVSEAPKNDPKIFAHDAMPYWWMAHLLLTHLRSVQVPPSRGGYDIVFSDFSVDGGPNRLIGVDLASMLQTARGLSVGGPSPTLS